VWGSGAPVFFFPLSRPLSSMTDFVRRLCVVFPNHPLGLQVPPPPGSVAHDWLTLENAACFFRDPRGPPPSSCIPAECMLEEAFPESPEARRFWVEAVDYYQVLLGWKLIDGAETLFAWAWAHMVPADHPVLRGNVGKVLVVHSKYCPSRSTECTPHPCNNMGSPGAVKCGGTLECGPWVMHL